MTIFQKTSLIFVCSFCLACCSFKTNNAGSMSANILSTSCNYYDYFSSSNPNGFKTTSSFSYHESSSQQNISDNHLLVPSYYLEGGYLLDKMEKVKTSTSLESSASFAFITDLHLYHNSLSSKELMKYVLDNSEIPFVFFGGDVPVAYANQSELAEEECLYQANTWDSWVNYWGKERVYQMRGNHDYITDVREGNNFYIMSEDETHNRIVSNYNNDVSIGDNLQNYYYFDLINQKIRFIVIDPYVFLDAYPRVITNYISSIQISWLLELLDNSDGYQIIMFCHQSCNKKLTSYNDNMSALHEIMSAYKNKKTFDGAYGGKMWSHDFSDKNGDLVCIISGHSHTDESNIDDGVLSIVTTCDAMYSKHGEDRTQGTINESAFDIFSVDTINKRIETTRIGAGDDRIWTY